MEDSPKKSGLNVGLIVLAIFIIVAVAIVAVQMTKKKEVAKQEQSAMAPTETGVKESTTTAAMAAYKNGIYSAVGDYMSPGGAEQIDVKVTLKDNVITDAVVVSKATRPNSKLFQGMFVSNFKGQVVGKNIDEVKLTKVSGSSLTPKGFNDALEKIKSQAKS